MVQLLTNWKNVVKFSKGNAESPHHREYKYYICAFCSMWSIDFYTEVVFKNNSRCDVYIPSWDLCVEILHTEKYKDAINKKYPSKVLFIPTDTDRLDVYEALYDLRDINGDGVEHYNNKFNIKNDKNTGI